MAKLCVPDHTGHKEYDFTPNSPAAKRAEKIFNKLMNKGYVGGKRMADGSLEKIHRFDPTAEEIFVHRQLVGGRSFGIRRHPRDHLLVVIAVCPILPIRTDGAGTTRATTAAPNGMGLLYRTAR